VNAALLADLVALVLCFIFAANGWRRGAARTLISTLALLASIYLSSVGHVFITEKVAQLFPTIPTALIDAVVFIGATWLLLALVAWLLGRIAQSLLRALGLGLIDSLFGALLGLFQCGLLLACGVFLVDLAQSFAVTLPDVAGTAAVGIRDSASASIVRSALFPLVDQFFGASLPDAIRAILTP
jgi:uncharacterized membrane protein required for colicin V production